MWFTWQEWLNFELTVQIQRTCVCVCALLVKVCYRQVSCILVRSQRQSNRIPRSEVSLRNFAHKRLLEKCTPSWEERKAELTRWTSALTPRLFVDTFPMEALEREKKEGRRRRKKNEKENTFFFSFFDGWGLLLLHLERTQLWRAVKYTQTSRLLQTRLSGTRPHIPMVGLWHMITARQYVWEQSTLR